MADRICPACLGEIENELGRMEDEDLELLEAMVAHGGWETFTRVLRSHAAESMARLLDCAEGDVTRERESTKAYMAVARFALDLGHVLEQRRREGGDKELKIARMSRAFGDEDGE